MNDETLDWIRYASENHQAAKLMLDHGLMNLCLQNCQQATEKFLKALFDPDTAICRRCLALVEKTEIRVRDVLRLPRDKTD